jgi:hypothetical protein
MAALKKMWCEKVIDNTAKWRSIYEMISWTLTMTQLKITTKCLYQQQITFGEPRRVLSSLWNVMPCNPLMSQKTGLFIATAMRTSNPIFCLIVWSMCEVQALLWEKSQHILKSTVLWDITPCSPMKVSHNFRGTYRFLPQSGTVSQAGNQHGS